MQTLYTALIEGLGLFEPEKDTDPSIDATRRYLVNISMRSKEISKESNHNRNRYKM